MADDRDDRTEQASQRRLKLAWEEGQIPLGHDVTMAAALASGAVAALLAGPALRDSLVSLVADAARTLPESSLESFGSRLLRPALLVLAVAGASAVGAALATLAQTKGNVWPHLAMPDLSRLFQGQRLTRLVSREFLVDLGLSLFKLVAIAGVLWLAARSDFAKLGQLLFAPPSGELEGLFAPLAHGMAKVLAAIAALALVELVVTRHRFASKMKMTREELKREFREEEGDPLLRSRRRRRHREILKNRAALEVPRADALVVNPTHIAVAIRYRKSEGKAPKVTAKGKGVLAEHMRDLARGNGVPIVEDVPLARLLYRRVKVGREVPMETYKAVAAILAFVYRVTGRTPGG